MSEPPPTAPRTISPEPISLRAALGLLAAIRLATNTGFRLVYPFLPAIARGIGVPFTQAGFLVSARSLAGLAVPLVVETAGRGERRRRLATTSLVTFVAGAAVTATFGTYAGVLVGFALIGLAKPTFDVAAHSYLADRTPYRRRARVLGILELTWAGSMLIGAPAVGWLIARHGWQSPFWVLAVLVGIGAVVVHVALGPDRPTDATGEPERWSLRLDRSAWGLLGVMVLSSLAAETSFVVFGAWLEDRFALSLVALGGAGAVVAVAELAGSTTVLGAADRIGKRRTVMIGMAVATIGFAFLPWADRLAPGLLLFALALYGYELTIVAAIPLASELRPATRGRYLSFLVVAVGLGRSVGAAIGPAMFERFGIAADVTVSVVGNLLAIAVLAAFVVEDPEHGPPPPPAPSHIA